MGSYVVTSSNLTVAAEGSTVTADQLAGCDIPALVAGGHLAPLAADVPPPAGTSPDELAAAEAELAKAQADLAAVQTSADPVPTQPPADKADTPKEQ